MVDAQIAEVQTSWSMLLLEWARAKATQPAHWAISETQVVTVSSSSVASVSVRERYEKVFYSFWVFHE